MGRQTQQSRCGRADAATQKMRLRRSDAEAELRDANASEQAGMRGSEADYAAASRQNV